MKTAQTTLATLSLLLCSAAGPCGHSPTPPDPPPTPPGSPCERACQNLAKLGCPEGQHADCAADCEAGMGDKITDFHPDCLAQAATPEEARACRSVHCTIKP
jgi:hypothetical protein